MLTIRPATMGDAPMLWAWRNDPVTRAMSRRTHEIPWEEYRQEIVSHLGDEHLLLIVESDGVAVAVGRFDYGDEVEFSFSIAPEWRHSGISLSLAKLAMAQEPEFIGYIKRSNIPSQRLMTAAGMVMIEDGELQHWRYQAQVPGVPPAEHFTMAPVASTFAVSPATKVPVCVPPVSVAATAAVVR